MPIQTMLLVAAMAGFVGGHILLSHVLRAPLVGSIGESRFRMLYSAIAVILLVAATGAFRAAPHEPVLWHGGHWITQAIYDVLTYFSLVLFIGSLFGNPASIGANRQFLDELLPRGVFQLTRHPMMFFIAIWSIAEILLVPSLRQLIFFGGLALLAIVGSGFQDRKLSVLVGSDWQAWRERTSFWPNLGKIAAPGVLWLIALIPWLIVTWLHSHIWQVPVGVWLFDPTIAE